LRNIVLEEDFGSASRPTTAPRSTCEAPDMKTRMLLLLFVLALLLLALPGFASKAVRAAF